MNKKGPGEQESKVTSREQYHLQIAPMSATSNCMVWVRVPFHVILTSSHCVGVPAEKLNAAEENEQDRIVRTVTKERRKCMGARKE